MCFSLAHLWQFLESPALVGEGDQAEVEWLWEKLEKLAIRRGNCNEKMILNRANTILPWLSFSLSRRKQVMTSCLGFFHFPVAEPTGKELEKKVSIVPRCYLWHLQREVPSNWEGWDSCFPRLPEVLVTASVTTGYIGISQEGLPCATVTRPDPQRAPHLLYLLTAVQLIPVFQGLGWCDGRLRLST